MPGPCGIGAGRRLRDEQRRAVERTTSAFEGGAAPIGNDLASVVGSISLPDVVASAGAAKAEAKKPAKKSVAKAKLRRW